ncbi:MAG: PAS domain S-box protein [Methylobacter sp.]|nr:MAG: PAS domain S-box protein [Methylobacter sp.]
MTDKPRILIIDDDAMSRMLASEALGRNGFEIMEAENGRQGIALFMAKPPDLVLLDVIMPEMDGFECLRLLCGELHSEVPIVMMTAVEDIQCVELAYQLGATDFIGKPMQWMLLPYRVRFVLRNRLMNQLLSEKQRQLRQSEERLRLSLSAAKQGMWDFNIQTEQGVVNGEFANMLGYDPQEYTAITLDNWSSNIHPGDFDLINATCQAYLAGELPEYRVEFRQRCADGSWKWVLCLGSIVERDHDGRPLRMLGTYTDINDSKIAADRLQLLAKVFEYSGEGIILCDANTRILSSNEAYSRITGYLESEARNKTPYILSTQQHDQAYYQGMCKAVKENGYWQGEIWDVRKNGETYPVLLGISVIRNSQGFITNYICIFSDITSRKAAEAKIEYLAHHDALTKLPNRTLLNDRFDQAKAQALRNNTLVAVLFLDLDRFKHINDTLGHNVGDLLLQGIAGRLSHCVRQVDSVCRQGGDEFIIILTDLPDAKIATRIAMKILEQLHKPFAIEGVTVSTSFSIGISLFPIDGMSFQKLLTKADTAMYAAKNKGRNTFKFFAEDMDQASIERITIESKLQVALEKKQFQLYFQPMFALHDNHIIGVEALLRWQPDKLTSIPPKKFIPIAEDNGMMLPIGNWVLQQACLQNRHWHDVGLKLLVTVNISSVQFRRGDLVESVKAALALSGLEPKYLELELTESVLMVDSNSVIKVIHELKALGISFAIDDFGTGYSSLSYLKQFPINKLKIDQSFTRGLSSGKSEDSAIVQAIIQLGKTLELQTLAEGIETHEQAEQLTQLGCENGQGFFWHHPMAAKDFEALCLKGHQPKPQSI